MKRTLSLFLAAAMTLSLMAGCAPKSKPGSSSGGGVSSSASPGGDVSVPAAETLPKFMVLSGPTGVGAAKLMDDEKNRAEDQRVTASITVEADNQAVSNALMNGDADIAAIATNVAATLSAKSNGAIQVLAINTLGVLYILEKGDTVQSMSDLKGKTLYATGQGANPEYVLNYLLKKNEVDPAQVDIQWMTAQEITAKMASEEAAICMLPVPAATALLVKDETIRQAVSLSDEWDKLDRGALPMGCIAARTQYVEENPQSVEKFLEEYAASIDYIRGNEESSVLSGPASPPVLVASFELTPNATIAAAAIPQCNLTYLAGEEMKLTLERYYQILFQANPAAIGGSMPYDSFYYGVG